MKKSVAWDATTPSRKHPKPLCERSGTMRWYRLAAPVSATRERIF
jgi:hypothetical protein